MQDASTTAAKLLAFHAEPVRHRPRLTHGRHHFSGGLHVFRFAQGKFPEGLIRKLPEEERQRLRDAAVFFIRQVCCWDGATHYQVLCAARESLPMEIRDHYQGLMALIHPDRVTEGGERWPEDFAQRANKAWAILSDTAARKEYDAELKRSAHTQDPTESFEPPDLGEPVEDIPVRRKSHSTRKRVRTTLAIASLSLACLFFAFTWWASDVPPEFATLQGATPFQLSLQWMRDVGSPARRPGFLGRGDALASHEAPATDAELALMQASLVARKPDAAGEKELDRIPVAPRPVTVVSTKATPPAPSPDTVTRSRPETVTSSDAVEQRVANAAANANLAERLPDLEVLVTRLVAYYEGGDLERFVGLFDADSLGVIRAYRVRSDFDDFFRATAERRLRIQQVSWTPAEGKLRAKGQATVSAEYRDAASRLERAVNLEIDVVMRGGSPRIARLSLYPHE